MKHRLDPVFNPRSIAVVGASRNPAKVGAQILHKLITYGFQGTIYPVNKRARDVHSIRAYSSVLDIPDDVDLAVIVVPSEYVIDVMEECAEKGIRGAVVITAGFKEIGGKGIELEQELLRLIRKHRIATIGPNCMGIINTSPGIKMDATFAPTYALHGKTAFMSQSGALGLAVLDHAKKISIGFSKFVSLGNKADVSGNDLLEYWGKDPETDVILMYIESFGNPRNFVRIAREITPKKPVIALKSGRTEAGKRAAVSHTGSLAGLDEATDALFEQCGVIRVGSIEELFDLATAFSMQPPPQGRNVGIVTNAGGPAIMATDALVSVGLDVPRLREKTQEKLRAALIDEAITANPVDMTAHGDPKGYEVAIRAVLNDSRIDSCLVIFVPPAMVDELEVANTILKVARRHKKKTILSCFLGSTEESPGFAKLTTSGVPAYLFPESAAKALTSMYAYGKFLQREKGTVKEFKVNRKKVAKIFDACREDNRYRLNEVEVLEVLETYGFSLAKYGVAKDLNEAKKIADEIGYPVVLKAMSPQIVHKSDFGGIALDVEDEGELKRKLRTITRRIRRSEFSISGYLIQEYVTGGKEVIIGMKNDPKFGPLVMFGLGGIYVEILKDVAFRLTPLTDADADRMIKSIKGYPLLTGVRGEKPSDMKVIIDHLQRVSQVVNDFYRIEELDINPMIVFGKGKGAKIVDARMVIGERRTSRRRELQGSSRLGKHPRLRGQQHLSSL
ncbi:MAG: acetate--CoA ligase family protein [Thermoplasmata archaeon]